MFTSKDTLLLRGRQIELDVVTRRIVQVLVDAQIALRRRQAGMAEAELDLIELGAAFSGAPLSFTRPFPDLYGPTFSGSGTAASAWFKIRAI